MSEYSTVDHIRVVRELRERSNEVRITAVGSTDRLRESIRFGDFGGY